MWARFKDIVVNTIEAVAETSGTTSMSTAVPFQNGNFSIVIRDAVNAANETQHVNTAEVSTSNDDTQGALRVSTRARFSYELDRYKKNALLIFEGNASHALALKNPVQNEASQTEDNSKKFTQAFAKFGFEAEIHKNLTDEQIASTCDTFFQRDFSEYGCLAVMMLARTRDGIVESKHTPQSENGVLRYISDLMPASLQNKPKIYIVQTESFHVVPGARMWSTPPQHVFELRLPVPIVSAPDASGKRSKFCCILEHIYEKITGLADKSDLHTVLQDAVNDFRRVWQQYDLPVEVYSSLTKELRLARKNIS